VTGSKDTTEAGGPKPPRRPRTKLSPRERTNNYRKQIDKYTLWNDTQLALRFGDAGQYVKELCEIEQELHRRWNGRTRSALKLHTDRQKLVHILLHEYPKAAKELGLSPEAAAQSSESRPANKNQKALTEREEKIWEVIRRGSKGRQYCRELDSANIAPRRDGVWKEGPRKYEAAYHLGSPWRHRIEDEKAKIRSKTQALKLAGALASE
jgi:hypothetical protein